MSAVISTPKKRDGVSRKAAKNAGELIYYNGEPCPKGHNQGRYTSSGGCVVCLKAHSASRLDYYRQRYQEQREKLLAQSRLNHQANRESRIERQKEWAKENPERVREIKRAYKLRRKSIETTGDTTREVAAWAKDQKKVCHWCGVKCDDDYHIDHYYPLSKGGKHEVSNLVIACPTCNMRKNAKDPYDFAQERGRLF